jgi:hypothetical protein
VFGGFTTGQELDPQQQDWIDHYQKQKNAPEPSEMLLNTDDEPELNDGFTELFNGKDLTGWTAKGGTCTFEVKDEQIVGTCVVGSESTYLSTDKSDYKDFVFTCELKMEVDGNTGVQFRSNAKPNEKIKDAETVYGPQKWPALVWWDLRSELWRLLLSTLAERAQRRACCRRRNRLEPSDDLCERQRRQNVAQRSACFTLGR